MKKDKKLIILRGAPASGKSTLARTLARHYQKHHKVALLTLDEFKWVMNASSGRDEKDFRLAFKNFLQVLENYCKAGYLIIAEDVWTQVGKDKSTNIAAPRRLAEKYGYEVDQVLLRASWKTVSGFNSCRPMVLSEKDLKAQYKAVYGVKYKGETEINIDRKTKEQVLSEALSLIDQK